MRTLSLTVRRWISIRACRALRRVGLAIFSIVFSSGALAWNALGHRLVAAIAWEEMHADTRAAVTRLLREHPDYPRWRKRAGEDATRSDIEQRIFIEASTWPDEIRQDARF